MMKFLLFTLLLGIAACAVVRVDQPDFEEIEAYGATASIGDYLKDALQNLVDRVKDTVDRVSVTANKLSDKVTELKQKLDQLGREAETNTKEAVERVRQKVRDVVKAIEDNIRQQVHDVKSEVEGTYYQEVRELLQKLKEQVSKKINNLRQYLKEKTADNETAKQVERILDQLKESDLADIFNNLVDLSGHEMRHVKDLYQQLRDLAKRADGDVKKALNSFLDYVDIIYKEKVYDLVNVYKTLKGNLLKVVDSTKDFSVDAVKEALKHLQEYKEHLGDMYAKLAKSLKDVIYKE